MNPTQNLSPKEIFSFGFTNAKKYFWQFLLWLVVYVVCSMIPVLNIFGVIYLLMSGYFTFIKIARGEEVTLKTFFTWPKNGFRALWSYIVYELALMAMIGIMTVPVVFLMLSGIKEHSVIMITIGGIIILLCFIAFIYYGIRMYFAIFVSLEDGSWAIASIKKSWEITKDKVWSIIWVSIVSIGVMLLGAIALGIGLLWAMPTIIIAWAYVYVILAPKNNVMANSSTVIEVQPTEIPAHTVTTESVVEDTNSNTTN